MVVMKRDAKQRKIEDPRVQNLPTAAIQTKLANPKPVFVVLYKKKKNTFDQLVPGSSNFIANRPIQFPFV
jgi:hypothetical protein